MFAIALKLLKLRNFIHPILIILLLGTVKTEPVMTHPGHGDEFDHDTNTVNMTGVTIEIEPETARQMGIRVETVTREIRGRGINTTGQLETLFDQQVEVTTNTSGKVVELLVQQGDTVEQGQPIAVISSLELLELQGDSLDRQTQAQGDLEQALVNVELTQQDLQRQRDIAEAQITSARTDLMVAQEKYEGDLELEQEGALPRRQMLESKAQLAKVESELQQALSRRGVIQAEAELKRAQAAVKSAQKNLELSDRTYQTRLRQLQTPDNEQGLVTIYAPISGIVAHREATLGQSFDEAGGKLMTLVNNQEVWATGNIYEKDLAQVQLGQEVRVKVSGMGDRTFFGTIEQIDSVVEEIGRVIPVRAKISNGDETLKPGMFAQLEIFTSQTSTPIIAVPDNALMEVNGQHLVYVQNSPTTYQGVEITLGDTFSDWVEIEQGLTPGDSIVVEGANMLYAQSLRGGNATDSHDDDNHNNQEEMSGLSNSWRVFAISGFIAVSAFILGRSSQKKQDDSSLNFLEANSIDK